MDNTSAHSPWMIKSGLVFNKHSGSLSGFVDLGSANRDIEVAVGGSGDLGESSTGQLAEQVFVFLARAVFKPSLSVPIAHYFSASLKGMYLQCMYIRHMYVGYIIDDTIFLLLQEKRYSL